MGPSKSPALHTKFLCLIFSHATGITEAHIGAIKSFTNVTHLEVWADDSCHKPDSLNVLHNVLPAVETLRVDFDFLHLLHLFALIGLSPSIKDLAIYGLKIHGDGDDIELPLPAFTGNPYPSLRSEWYHGPIICLSASGLRFRKIVWRLSSSYNERSVKHMTDLIEMFSNSTLEYIDFDLALLGGSHPFGFSDVFSI